MGLDMYLEAQFHLPPYDSRLAPMRAAIGRAIGYAPPAKRPGDDGTLMQVTDITVRVGYWRKFEPLHQWFVGYVQEGLDDCRPVYVAPDVLAALDLQLDRGMDEMEGADGPVAVTEEVALAQGELAYTREVLVQARKLQECGWDLYYRASW